MLCAGVHMQRCVAGRMGNCADLHAPLRTFCRFVINLGLPPLSHRFVINIGPPPPLRFNTATYLLSTYMSLPPYLPPSLPPYLPTYLPTYLPAYLPTY